MATLGVNKLRLTGGEPLVRSNLHRLVERLVKVPGIEDVALTTNGILLTQQAAALRAAGLSRLNISLDTLDAATFQRIARRPGLDRVLEGIEAARQTGFDKIRLNAVAIRGITEAEIVPLARYSLARGLELRFIEFMPLDADRAWDNSQVLSGAEILAVLEAAIGPLEPLPMTNPSQPATDYRFVDGSGTIGFINPVTQPFCGDCNRLRLTAEGQLATACSRPTNGTCGNCFAAAPTMQRFANRCAPASPPSVPATASTARNSWPSAPCFKSAASQLLRKTSLGSSSGTTNHLNEANAFSAAIRTACRLSVSALAAWPGEIPRSPGRTHCEYMRHSNRRREGRRFLVRPQAWPTDWPNAVFDVSYRNVHSFEYLPSCWMTHFSIADCLMTKDVLTPHHRV